MGIVSGLICAEVVDFFIWITAGGVGLNGLDKNIKYELSRSLFCHNEHYIGN